MKRLEEALTFLMERLSRNVEKVKSNSALAKEIIEKDPFAESLEALRDENKMILNENKELLNLQVVIRKYLAVYKIKENQLSTSSGNNSRSAYEFYQLTISGEIELNEKHPMANNMLFLNELMDFYKQHEIYEKCDAVLKLIDLVKKNEEHS